MLAEPVLAFDQGGGGVVLLTGDPVGSTVQPGFLDGHEAVYSGLGGDNGDVGGFQLASKRRRSIKPSLGSAAALPTTRWAKSASTAAMDAWWRGP